MSYSINYQVNFARPWNFSYGHSWIHYISNWFYVDSQIIQGGKSSTKKKKKILLVVKDNLGKYLGYREEFWIPTHRQIYGNRRLGFPWIFALENAYYEMKKNVTTDILLWPKEQIIMNRCIQYSSVFEKPLKKCNPR